MTQHNVKITVRFMWTVKDDDKIIEMIHEQGVSDPIVADDVHDFLYEESQSDSFFEDLLEYDPEPTIEIDVRKAGAE